MPIVAGNLKRLQLFRNDPSHKENLWKIANALQSGLKEKGFDLGVTNSPVTPVFMKGGMFEACNLIVDLRENYDIFTSMVVYPVVPKGVIMLRLIPTAVHTLEDVKYTIEIFEKVQKKLQNNEYDKEKITFA
jgi:glycine C-acetyltransferase